ncbi:MAG: ABC transporter substrate-binding protein [Lachnospiraceae bacterium]|nr:ABC transporter substrate-binding protein [Lachnospiraceae bacterium]
MKKKVLSLLMAMSLAVGILCGCGQTENAQNAQENNQQTEQTENEPDVEEDVQTEVVQDESESGQEDVLEKDDDVVVRVGSLKGPTSIGLVKLWKDAEEGKTDTEYEFSMSTAADEILPLMIKGDLDIALVPANAAANLYQKSEGAIAVLDINTLGVLYMISGDSSISTMEDLKGKTIYLTGKGTTPDLALQYLLASHDIKEKDVTIEYKSEAAEVAAALSQNTDLVGLLPMPFVIAACSQNEKLQIVLDVNALWEEKNDQNGLVTGVTIVRKAFLEEHPDCVDAFLEDHKNSASYVNENVKEAAELVVENGIVEKTPVAEKAIPKCNITCITGEEMKEMLSAYLEILEGQDASFIGGKVPDDDFYVIRP